MQNPNLELTIITKPDAYSATVFENRIMDESKVKTNWTNFIVDMNNSCHVYDAKEIAPLLIPVSWKVNGYEAAKDSNGKEWLINGQTVPRRCADNIDSWFMLPIDIDDYLTMEKAKELYKEFEYIGYTTFNHTDQKNKYRLLFPLSKPIKHSKFLKKKLSIEKFIGAADPVSMSAAQGFFLPSCHRDNKDISDVWHRKGNFIDLHSFEDDKNDIHKSIKPDQKKWYLDKKPNLSNNITAADYLHDFIEDYIRYSGDHRDCLKLHSILKAFEIEENKHIDIMSTFKSIDSSHNIKQGYKSADSNFGGIGQLVNLLKAFGVYEQFNINRFKMLAGLV